MVQINVRVGILGPAAGFDPYGPSEWGCWAKSHGTHNAPLFMTGEFSLPRPTCRWEQGTVNACVFQRARFRGVFYFW